MSFRFAVAPRALPMAQVLWMGDDFSRHECFEDAVQRVCTASGVAREQLWFRQQDGALCVFEGWSCRVQRPLAHIYDPIQYQAVLSRGDLAGFPPNEFPAGPGTHPRPGDQTKTNEPTMAFKFGKPNQKSSDAKLGEATYFLVNDDFVWRGQRYRQGNLLTVQPRDKAEDQKLRLHLQKGWIRLATEEEKNTPPVAEPASGAPAQIPQTVSGELAPPATDRRDVSLAVAPATGVASPVQMVRLDRIKADPTQPREDFEGEEMTELVDSIKQRGVRMPILLRPMSRWRRVVSFLAREWARPERGEPLREIFSTDLWAVGVDCNANELRADDGFVGRLVSEGRAVRSHGAIMAAAGAAAPLSGNTTLPGEPEWLEIVYGERRFRASGMAGRTEIPAQIEDLSDEEAAELQAMENLQRAGLKPMEEARGYRKLLDLPGWTMAKVIERTGRGKSTIHGKLKLLELPEEAKKAVVRGELNPVTAERIARLEGPVQEQAMKEILHPGWRSDGAKVLADRAAQEVIQRAKDDQKQKEAQAAAEATAEAEGYTILRGDKASGVTSYDGETVPPNCGYVGAKDVCPRDPKRRTWRALVESKEAAALPRPVKVILYAVVHRNYRSGKDVYGTVGIYERDQVNPLIKALGLWEAEGSKVDKEKEAKRQAREKKARDEAEMVRDFEAIIAHAQRERSPRLPLLAAVWTMTHGYTPAADKVATRRGWMTEKDKLGRGSGIVRSMATDLEVRELQGLVAELVLFEMGTAEDFYKPGRRELRRLFDLEYDGEEEKRSANARTNADSEEPEEIASL